MNDEQPDLLQTASPLEASTSVPVQEELEATLAPEQIDTETTPSEPLPIMSVNELRTIPMTDLQAQAEEAGLRLNGEVTKSRLVFELGRYYLNHQRELVVEGVMEQAKDNYAMLRDPVKSFKTSPDDIYVPGDLIRKFHLKAGNWVKVRLRPLRPRDKYLSASEVLEVEGKPADAFVPGKDFDRLTPLFPRDRIILENRKIESPALRVLDLMSPFGKGQRGLIVAAPP